VSQPNIGGVRLSLWRAAVGFRVVAAALCIYLIGRWQTLYERPSVAVGVAFGIVLVTAVVVVVGLTGRAHRPWFALTDLGITLVLTVLTMAAQTHDQSHGGMPTLTTVWAAGPVIEVGLVTGWIGGLAAALAQGAASLLVRQGSDGRTLTNALLLVVVGAVAGYVASRAWRDERAAAAFAARDAALTERDRLTRNIHDGVLQVLGLVHRKGLEAGGEWADIAREAGDQEAALRALITSQAIRDQASGDRNLVAEFATLRSATVTVEVPDTVMTIDAGRAADLVSVVKAALHNVAQHAGPDAHAWVLLEHVGTNIVVTVRDDGTGFEPTRLEEAAGEGRLGVVQSIKGRVHDLGGRVSITSQTGQGTEVEVVIPWQQ